MISLMDRFLRDIQNRLDPAANKVADDYSTSQSGLLHILNTEQQWLQWPLLLHSCPI